MSEKITDQHVRRKAILYVRQSTTQQVLQQALVQDVERVHVGLLRPHQLAEFFGEKSHGVDEGNARGHVVAPCDADITRRRGCSRTARHSTNG